MKYFKVEVVADGLFPMDGSTEDNALSIISDHLSEIGLTVIEVFTEEVEMTDQEAIDAGYIVWNGR